MFNNFNSCTLYFTLYIKKCLINLILERFPTGENSFCSKEKHKIICHCLLYTSPSPRDGLLSRMPSSA